MKKPNIIIIVIDSLRVKNMGLYGYSKETDKNIQNISKESIVFNNCYTCSNATVPSLTALLTAKYPINNGIIHQLPYTSSQEIENLRKNKFWFPSFLKEKGYDTIALDWIGLWLKKGFNYYEEKEEKQSRLKKIMNIPLVKKLLLSLPNWIYKFGKKILRTRSSPTIPSAEKTIDTAINKIKESNKPFFLFLHFWDTHFPFLTVEKKQTIKENDMYEILNKIPEMQKKEYIKKRLTDISLYSLRDIVDKYDLSVKYVDEQIGRLEKYLKEKNLWNDTIFIIMADHGESMGEHDIYFSHSGLYDETIHVPLIMHIPNFNAKFVDGFIQNIDLIPTIINIMGIKNIDKDIDGKSFLQLIKKNKDIRNKVYAFESLANDVKAIRDKKRKLIVEKDGKCHLCKTNHHNGIEEFDLVKDPQEKTNCYNGESYLKKFLL